MSVPAADRRVLCIGDRFITPGALASAVRRRLGADTECVEYGTDWPDQAFDAVDGVREASGDPAELAGLIAGCDAVVTHLGAVTDEVIRSADRLRVVGVTRGGPVNVDLPAATRAGVPVIYLPGRNLEAVAEFTLGLMLALPRGIAPASRELSQGSWDASFFRFDRVGPELRGATVGLVGAGAVGRRVGEVLLVLGATVLVHDPFVADGELGDAGFQPAPLADVLARSDIVSVHARLTDNTRRMFDAAAFAAMKPGSYFVNTARGELVDQPALTDALRAGHLAGAALDVFDPEPPRPNEPLLTMANVIATPHLAGASREVALHSADRIAAAVATFLETGEVGNCANPDWSAHATVRR